MSQKNEQPKFTMKNVIALIEALLRDSLQAEMKDYLHQERKHVVSKHLEILKGYEVVKNYELYELENKARKYDDSIKKDMINETHKSEDFTSENAIHVVKQENK